MIDANTFALSVAAITVEITRTAVEITDAYDLRSLSLGLGGVTSTWTASIVTPTGERREVARRGGGFVSPRSIHSAESVDRIALNSVIEAASWHVEAINRLTVMVERAMSSLSPKASKKTRTLMEAGALKLANYEVGGGNDALIVVAGETAFVVSRNGTGKQISERTYSVGDRAVHSGYNLAYIGEIVSISAKTIKIQDKGERGHVLKHSDFAFWNRSPIEDSYKRNAEWSD